MDDLTEGSLNIVDGKLELRHAAFRRSTATAELVISTAFVCNTALVVDTDAS
jgi:hypothetical protein